MMELPCHLRERVVLWEEIKRERNLSKEHLPIKIKLPDGSFKEGESWKTTPLDIALQISKGLAKSVIIAKVNDVLWDLSRPFETDSSLELLKWDSSEAQRVFWHSSAHILGEAMELKYKGNLCIGPSLEDGGFYYDISLQGTSIAESDYGELNEMVSKIVLEKQAFERLELTREEALELFKDNKYKVEIIKDKVPEGAKCTAYKCGTLIDLCKGPHVLNSGVVKASTITMNSSSYWKGNIKNDVLQRVYGISFPEKKLLEEWLDNRRRALEHDHRLIGKNQELFIFDELSPGSVFMLPHGTKIYNKLQDLVRREYRKRGFQEVITPNIFSVELWKSSGHWQNYKDNMFNFKVEEQDWALKPMNCPGHCLIFGSKQRSYKELPLRLADFGVLHRNEISGALTGLTRVRRFQQDDAHIFCMPEQIQDEIRGALDFLKKLYKIFNFDFSLELSTMPENHLGDLETWMTAEEALRRELDSSFPSKWKINPGDGAFYGPKIDISITDALKKRHQCGTIQLDFQLPLRFKLKFISSDGVEKMPVIIHRAIFGSIERFMAILIEHTGGKWPFWISPRQAIVVSINEKNHSYANSVRDKIFDAGFDCDIDESDHLFNKKIRNAQMAKYNFIIVIGSQEEEKGTVNVRTRDNVVHGERTVEELIEEFKKLSDPYGNNN